LYIQNLVRGYVFVSVEGFFIEKVINKCKKDKINLMSLRRKSSTLITAQINVNSFKDFSRIVKKNMFTPMPKVDSAIVRIDFKNKYEIFSHEVLQKLIRSAFQMRRKTLTNNIKIAFNLSNEDIQKIYKKLGLELNVRGESLSTMQFVELSNILSEIKP